MQFGIKCSNHDNNPKYTQKMMIHDYHHKSETIDGKHVWQWFKKHEKSILASQNEARKCSNIITKMRKICTTNINYKKQHLQKFMEKSLINEYILHAPLRQLQIYDMFVECIKQIHSPCLKIRNQSLSKYCICCKKQYYMQMLFCLQYCGDINLFNMTQCLTNDNICCCFCLRKVHKHAKLVIDSEYQSKNTFQICKLMIQNRISKQKAINVCWWDLSEYVWRYGIIENVLKKTDLTLKVKLFDTDSICPLECIKISLKYLPNNSFFVFWYEKNQHKHFLENEFSIDKNNENMIDWWNFSNAFDEYWQIPIVFKDIYPQPAYFQQINDSVTLFNLLCDENVV